ncbi:uncharacterized protein SAPINGB_P003535 [Magnusiomyces paraingens]|uniref:Uncharacterized protein n=1 Tax=Magnusiomyces paraingens TaxID=2606893 RepID=A0A5E8BQQ6_9ASCO|nr:uncharacterized protein SAPINGB_P003535 [Saprochaete ingens]VVT53361.1 unnamed protein product [Saprochaete ingens]
MANVSVFHGESTAPILHYLNTFRSYVVSKLAIFFLIYLSTFILFAIIRVVTGVSIKRLGFMSLRHISFSPSADTSIFIRSIKLTFHRPTFSRPGWFGIIVNELEVQISLAALLKNKNKKKKKKQTDKKQSHLFVEEDEDGPIWAFSPSSLFLTRFIRLILLNARFFEITLTNTTVSIKDHISINVGELTHKVDLRKSAKLQESTKIIGTLDRHKFKQGEAAVVSRFTVKDIVLTPLNDPTISNMTRDEFLSQTELLDFFDIEVKGIIDVHKLALKGLAVGVRIGTLNLHIDRIRHVFQGIQDCLNASKETSDDFSVRPTFSRDSSISYSSVDTKPEKIVNEDDDDETSINTDETCAFKEPSQKDISTLTRFGTILVRIVKEVSVKFEHLSIRHFSLDPPTSPDETSDLKLSCTVKDIMIDIRRLNSENPSFRLFFKDTDSAHQAIFSCNSVSIGLYHNNVQEEILYIPLISTISKTNIFSKTIKLVKRSSGDENSNNSLLRTNINISTPSFNLKAHHFPFIIHGLSKKSKPKSHSKSRGFNYTNSTFQKLWPRAVIKFAIDEPAARIIVTPPRRQSSVEPQLQALCTDFSGMVVVSCSKIYCDFSSSHINDNGKQNYSLKSSLHSSALDVFYQSNTGCRYDLLASESFLLKIAAVLNPSLSLICTADLDGMRVSALHDEVLDGLQEVAHNFIRPKPKSTKKKSKPFFLRQFPSWLSHFYFKISNINFAIGTEKTFDKEKMHHEVLGLDVGVSNFVIDYRSHLEEQKNLSLINPSDNPFLLSSENDFLVNNADLFNSFASSGNNNTFSNSTDDRNLAITFEGIYGYKIINAKRDPNSLFLSIPRFSAAFFTSSDTTSPFIRTNFILRNANISWDFHLQYLITLTIHVIRLILPKRPITFNTEKTESQPYENHHPQKKEDIEHEIEQDQSNKEENFDIHFQTGIIRFKAKLPNDVNVMFETNSLNYRKSREYVDTVAARVIRLYTDHPNIPNAWTRLFVLSDLRVTFKEDFSNLKKPYVVDDNEQILLELRSIRIHITNHLRLYRVFDNIISSFKGVIILAKTAKTGQLEPGHAKMRNTMPNIPKIRIRSKGLFLGIEDDIFESKLGLIFRVGLREQRLRLEKEEQFEEKVKAVLSKSTIHTTKSSPSTSVPLSRPSFEAKSSIRHANTQPAIHSPLKDEIPASTLSINDKNSSPSPPPPHINPHRTVTMDSLKPGFKYHNPIKHLHSGSQTLPQVFMGRRRHKQMEEPQNEILDESAFTSQSTVSIEAARRKLLENFSTSWIRAHRAAEANQKRAVREQVELSLGIDEVDPETLANERIIDYSPYPFLFFVFINNTDLLIRKPDFDELGLRDFLYDIGKGQPRDTQFSLLIPLYLDLGASSLRVQIRDYPLPTVHFPELHPSQHRSTTSVSIHGNFIIAENYSDKKANIRDIDIPLIAEAAGHTDDPEFYPYVARVKRTVASIKTFTSLQVHGRSHFPTRISHCQAHQPGMQASMQVFDTFSKPPIDPSEKMGFWDKIRLVLHARLQFHWKESDVHFMLKGSRNPYHLLGCSAGFVMVWRNNVVLSINQDDDPKRLFSLSSDDYLLAVPNFSLQEREYLSKYITVQNGLVCPTNFNESTTFQKVVMKLSGQVCWYMGMVFEREIERGTNLGRTFQFRPHYEVTLSKPEYVDDLSTYDAYRGFRSDYIHMAISVISPSHTEYNSDDGESVSNSYNSVHLSPKAFAHFHKWWELFDSASSLPVRNGKMFNYDDPMQKSKKLGRHLYTVKYQLLLSPLFITHAYLTSDYDAKTNSYSHHSTGLKGKIDHFTLDLHQRRSPNPGEELSTGKRWRMHLNVGELDFINTDLRVIQATFKEKSHQQSLAKKFGFSVSPGSSISNGYSHSSSSGHYTGKIKISDNDYSWIDMDDFDELGETSPATIFPKITVSPMLYSPRWSYFRQTDHDDPRKYGTFIPFGSENSHDCVIGNRPPEDSHKIIINSRLSELEEQLKTNETMLDSLKSDLERFPGVKATSDRIKKVQIDVTNLKERIAKVREIAVERFQVEDEIDTTARNVAKNVELARKVYDNKSAMGLDQATEPQPPSSPSGPLPEPYLGNEDDSVKIDTLDIPSIFEDGLSEFGIQVTRTITDCESVSSEPEFDQQRIEEPSTTRSSIIPPSSRRDSIFVPVDTHASTASSIHELHELNSIGSADSLEPLDTIANARGDSVFTNRFIIHSMQLKWNNEIRNSVSHYFARVSERKKHAYYITRRAVKYLEDLAEKHSLNHPEDGPVELSGEDIGDLLKELKSEFPGCDPHFNNMLDDMEGHLSAFDASLATTEGSFDAEEKYLIRLTSPQIQLVSDVNPDSAVLVTSENIQLKVIEIVDTERELGDQSRVLESRYGVFLQEAQFYVLSAENVKNNAYLYFSHNTYGCGKSAMWPPWLAVECCYDDQALEEFLVINKTSATLRYDKPNSLRIQESTSTEELQNTCTAALIRHEIHHQNRIAVDFPKIVATTDSHQFFAAYTIVIDLILYSEPVKKQHSEQLDKVLLTTDFNDLKKAINQVRDLQTKIRKFDDIRMEYITRMSELDESAIRDLAKVELIQDNLSFELGILVVAIKTGMQKGSRDEDSSQFFKWAIGANQIIWHVLDAKHRPFMDMGLADASFNRIENTDGFNANSVEVGVMQAFNLEPEAVYPEIFSPYVPNNGKFDSSKGKLMSINWTMLDPIGGIPIMQKFEVALRPLKLQFERNTWDKIFSFVFPVNKDGTRDDRPIFPSRNKKDINSPSSPTTYEHFSDTDDSDDDDDDGDDDSISDTASGTGIGTFLRKAGSIKLDSESENNSVRHRKLNTLNPFQSSRLSHLTSGSASIRSGNTKTPSPGTNSPEHKRSPVGTAIATNGNDDSHNGKQVALVETSKDDDVALMIKRASNYMAIVQIRFVETTVCVSYKGQGSRNLLDIHEFVLKVPEISYQNKTWSNMDLVLHLKKDITKVLLNHSGSLLGNKIKKHHQTRKKGQQLHQISDYVSFISVDDLASTESGRSSKKEVVPGLSVISEGDQSAYSLPVKNGGQVDSISPTGTDSFEESGNKARLSRQQSTSSTPSHTSSVLNHVLRPHSAKSSNNNDADDDKSTGKKRRMLKRLLNS